MKITNEKKLQISTLRAAGIGYAAIAKQLNLKKSTVSMHCQKQAYLAQHPPKEKKYKGSIQGRKSLQIKAFINSNPTATLNDIIAACELEVTPKTLSIYLKRMDMQCKVAKSRIVISNVNKAKRIAFCKEWLAKPDSELQKIWFSDETMVKSGPNGQVVLFRCPPGNEYFVPSNTGSCKSVMFWGVISIAAYGPLVEIIGKNTAEHYISTLREHLLPEIAVAEGEVYFQQDNAAIHKTAAVKSFMQENGIETFEWPPQSPDLSPIENIWNAMKMKMKAMRPVPKTHATMRDAMKKIWLELGDELRVGLLDTFRGRLTKCLKAKGDIIKF